VFKMYTIELSLQPEIWLNAYSDDIKICKTSERCTMNNDNNYNNV
jgi:hypothetical protein